VNKMSYNSGLTSTQNVNITGGQTNFPMAGTGQTPVVIMNTGGKAGQALTAGTGITAYTVTAGKTLYITDIVIGSNVVGTFIIKEDGSAGVQKYSTRIGVTNSVAIDNASVPISFAAGKTVWIDANVTMSETTFTLRGWEQ
jgi:hypothetical protein